MKKKAIGATLLCFLLCGCGAATILDLVNSIATEAEKITTADGTLTPAQEMYFSAGLNCSNEAAKEFATMDSAARKSYVIALDCAAIATGVIPAGLTTNQQEIALGLQIAVKLLLAALPPAAPTASGNVEFADAKARTAAEKVNTNPTTGQKAKLKKIEARIAKVREKLARKVARK